MAYDVRLIPIGKAGYKPVVLNADRFCMPYGTVTALCVCVCLCIFLSFSLSLFPVLPVCLMMLLSLFSPCLFVNAHRQNYEGNTKNTKYRSVWIQTHTHMCTHTKHTHTHWRIAAIRWGNQACEDRGALRGCSLLYGTCVCVCVCVCAHVICLCAFDRFLSLYLYHPSV